MTDTMSLAELDEEIDRLEKERVRVRQLLGDSDQSEARCLRRRYVFGQWLETLELSANHLVAIRKVADDEDVWLFDKDVMEADGWVVADSGSWSLPQARASSTTEEERS